jgi:hypothetical protein
MIALVRFAREARPMKAAHAPYAGQHRQPSSIFDDPWNEPKTLAAKVRITLAFAAFLLLVILFAATASAWVSSLSDEAAPRPATTLKSNEASRLEQSPVAVLAPSGMSAAQADEFARRFRATPDGYFSSVAFGGYDVVVNASSARSARGAEISVSETETGLAVAFHRDGAEYQVAFSCRGPANCISEAEARAVVAALVVLDEGAN